MARIIIVLATLTLLSSLSQFVTCADQSASSSQSVPVPAPGPVEASSPPVGVESVAPPPPAPGSFYSSGSPAALMSVVGEPQPVAPGAADNKPQGPGAVGAPGGVVGPAKAEFYGQPEPAPLPAGYKPFGSWGLYIGGNPSDGYYTNYYKQLSSQFSGSERPSPSGSSSSAAGSSSASGPSPSSPFLRQAVGPSSPSSSSSVAGSGAGAVGSVGIPSSSSPFGAGDYYPFAYSTSELNMNQPRFQPEPTQPQAYSAGGSVSPSQLYNSGPAVFDGYGSAYPSSYGFGAGAADFYAPQGVKGGARQVPPYPTKGGAPFAPPPPPPPPPAAPAPAPPAAFQQQQQQQQVQQQEVQRETAAKGYAAPAPPAGSYYHYYFNNPNSVQAAPSPASGVAPPAAGGQVQAYPVPVSSQIVGSQQGVDGAFQPYGIHAFTRYAVKPAVAPAAAPPAEPAYYFGAPAVGGVAPKMQQQQQQQQQQPQYYSQQAGFPFGGGQPQYVPPPVGVAGGVPVATFGAPQQVGGQVAGVAPYPGVVGGQVQPPQQPQQAVPAVGSPNGVVPSASAYPFSFYGYPLKQLHYASEFQPVGAPSAGEPDKVEVGSQPVAAAPAEQDKVESAPVKPVAA